MVGWKYDAESMTLNSRKTKKDRNGNKDLKLKMQHERSASLKIRKMASICLNFYSISLSTSLQNRPPHLSILWTLQHHSHPSCQQSNRQWLLGRIELITIILIVPDVDGRWSLWVIPSTALGRGNSPIKGPACSFTPFAPQVPKDSVSRACRAHRKSHEYHIRYKAARSFVTSFRIALQLQESTCYSRPLFSRQSHCSLFPLQWFQSGEGRYTLATVTFPAVSLYCPYLIPATIDGRAVGGEEGSIPCSTYRVCVSFQPQ